MDQPTVALTRVFNYTPEDLTANRSGELTSRQIEWLNKIRRSSMRNVRVGNLLIMGLLALLFFIPIIKALVNGTMPLETFAKGVIVIGVVVGGLALVALVVIRSSKAASRDYSRLSVQCFEGVVRCCKTNTYPVTSHIVRFDDRTFFMRNREQLNAFEMGRRYRVYYVHYMNSEFVLTVEALP